jgi:predicted RNA-binding protein Jag
MTADFQKELTHLLQLFVHNIDSEATYTIEKEALQWRINVSSEKPDLLIGDKGKNLRALQHLLRVLLHQKFPEDRTHFQVDVNSYKKYREQVLRDKLPEIAYTKVLNKGQTVIVVGLSGYERRLLHKFFEEANGLSTHSVGPRENRRLLIMPTSEFGAEEMDQASVIQIDKLQEEAKQEGEQQPNSNSS